MKPTKRHKVTKRQLVKALSGVIQVEAKNRDLVLVFAHPDVRSNAQYAVREFLGLREI